VSELDLSVCPICRAEGGISRQSQTRQGQLFTWCECRECKSVLVQAADGRWTLKRVGLADKQQLLNVPLTSRELVAMAVLPEVEPPPPVSQLVAPPPAESEPERRWLLPVVIGAVVAVVCLACVGGAIILGSMIGDEASQIAAGTLAPIPTWTRAITPTPKATREAQPTNTLVPTLTPKFTATPTPLPGPIDPVVFLELQSTGEMVSDNFAVPACEKAVFSWSVRTDDGRARLVTHLNNASGRRSATLVSLLEFDAGAELAGQRHKSLSEGEYFVSTESASGPWSVRGVCLDGQLPTGKGIDLQGTAETVSDNFELDKCGWATFLWSVEPDDGLAQFTVRLHKVGFDSSHRLINEMEFDVPRTLTGEVLNAVASGVYFLTVEEPTGPWSVRYECRD